MGGGHRGDRISHAAKRPGAAEEYRKDGARKLSDYDHDVEPKEMFISYHYDGAVQKINLLRYQAEHSDKLRFEETSSTSRYPNNWKPHAERDIKRSDGMLLILDREAHESRSVRWEIRKANEHGVPIVAVKTSKSVKVPDGVTQNGGKVVDYRLDAIQKGINTTVTYGKKE